MQLQHLTNVASWVGLFDIVMVQACKPKFYFDFYICYQLVRIVSQKHQLFFDVNNVDHSNHWIQNWVKVSEFIKNQLLPGGKEEAY